MDLINELNEVSNLLDTVLDRYMQTCATIPIVYEARRGTTEALLDSTLAELPKAYAYDLKLQQAKAALWRTRNQSPDLVPINTLPFEVLSHIFWLSWDCFLSTKHRHTLVYPGTLLRVCSRWRQIAFASDKLWSHLDVYLEYPPTPETRRYRSLRRAKLFTVQSNKSPLDLHTNAPLFSRVCNIELTDFCQSIAPRVRSLELNCSVLRMYPGVQQSWLGTLPSEVVAGNFTRLSLKGWDSAVFLAAADSSPIDCPHFRISITQQQLEWLLLSVTRLELRGIYLSWASNAYHNLAELILDGVLSSEIDIKIYELATILRESPGLQVFHFGLDIRLEQEIQFIGPVQLNQLASLQLTSRSHLAQSRVLHMIRPGRIPLELAIEVPDEGQLGLPSSSWVEFVSFAARSDIASLHIEVNKSCANYSKLAFDPLDVLPLLPRFEVLVLDGFLLGQQCEELFEGYDAASYLSMFTDYSHLPHGQLRVLILVGCKIYWNDFRHVSDIHPTEKLVLDHCEVDAPYPWRSDLECAVRRIVPIVEFHDTRGTHEDSELGD